MHLSRASQPTNLNIRAISTWPPSLATPMNCPHHCGSFGQNSKIAMLVHLWPRVTCRWTIVYDCPLESRVCKLRPQNCPTKMPLTIVFDLPCRSPDRGLYLNQIWGNWTAVMLVWFLACASISMPMSTDRWHDFDTFLTEFFSSVYGFICFCQYLGTCSFFVKKLLKGIFWS